MRKRTLFSTIVAAVLVLIAVTMSGCVKPELSCDELRQSANALLEQANYCSADYDCTLLTDVGIGTCPVLANKSSDLTKVRGLMKQYEDANCPVFTLQCPINPIPEQIKCNSGKCAAIPYVPGQTTYVQFQPMQCEGLPWWQSIEEAAIKEYYSGNYGIEIISVGEICTDAITCQACSVCPTGCFFEAEILEKDKVQMEVLGWTELGRV